MSHFGVIAPPLFSHFQAMQALAASLIQRGHQVTFFQQAEAGALIHDSTIGFHPLGLTTHPLGSLAKTLHHAARPSGLSIHRVIRDLAASTAMLCDELPEAITALGIDALICDQMEAAGGLVAEALGLPFVSVACALPVNREPGVPLAVMPFKWGEDPRTRTMYDTSTRVYDALMAPHRRVVAAKAKAFGLPSREGLHECLSGLVQVSQTLPGLEFPRKALPACFHHVGPLRSSDHGTEAPRWAIDPGQPFVFASLGTLQGDRYGLFKRITKACRALDVQLLVAHCGGLTHSQAQRLKYLGATWVTDFADQPAVLRQANAVISHGGLNTVMDAIAAGTPILALPIAFDQPGVAARVQHAGVGVQAWHRSPWQVLARRLTTVLDVSRYQGALAVLEAQRQAAGGAARAATLIERAVTGRRPVYSEATP